MCLVASIFAKFQAFYAAPDSERRDDQHQSDERQVGLKEAKLRRGRQKVLRRVFYVLGAPHAVEGPVGDHVCGHADEIQAGADDGEPHALGKAVGLRAGQQQQYSACRRALPRSNSAGKIQAGAETGEPRALGEPRGLRAGQQRTFQQPAERLQRQSGDQIQAVAKDREPRVCAEERL